MKGRELFCTAVALIVALALPSGAGAASPQKVLYSFTGGADGSQPRQGLIFDQAGNLYGTTWMGGAYGYGTVFQLTRNADGSWTEHVLYSFTGGSDGQLPEWGGLAMDAANNLYSTTNLGGESGAGTLFELSPNSDGTWTERVLHHFTGKSDGQHPFTTPIFDEAGNLYATSSGGGVYIPINPWGCGAAFMMTPGTDKQWTFRVIRQGGQPACAPSEFVLHQLTQGKASRESGGKQRFSCFFVFCSCWLPIRSQWHRRPQNLFHTI
jgi:uncharacterized repeat protein (TIGR03803 family)